MVRWWLNYRKERAVETTPTRKTRMRPAEPGPKPCPACRSAAEIIGITDPTTGDKALFWHSRCCGVDYHRWPLGNLMRRAADEFATRANLQVIENWGRP